MTAGTGDWRARLREVRGKSACRLTTRGRRSGKRHAVTVWFVAGEDGVVFLNTLRMDRDWPKNALKNPEVEIEIGAVRLKGTARLVTDESRRAEIESLFRSKYLVARIGSWFGLGPAGVFEVRVSGEAA